MVYHRYLFKEHGGILWGIKVTFYDLVNMIHDIIITTNPYTAELVLEII